VGRKKKKEWGRGRGVREGKTNSGRGKIR